MNNLKSEIKIVEGIIKNRKKQLKLEKDFFFIFWTKRKKEKYILNWLIKFSLLLECNSNAMYALDIMSKDKSLSFYSSLSKEIEKKLKNGIPISETLENNIKYFGNLYLYIRIAENSNKFFNSIKNIKESISFLYKEKITFFEDYPKNSFVLENGDIEVLYDADDDLQIDTKLIEDINNIIGDAVDKNAQEIIFEVENKYHCKVKYKINDRIEEIKKIPGIFYNNYIIRLCIISGIEYCSYTESSGNILMKIKGKEILFETKLIVHKFGRNYKIIFPK